MSSKKNPNSVPSKQFRGKVPQQPVDEWNRSYKKEPASPSSSRKKDSVQPGFQTAARPGITAPQDDVRGKRKGK